VFHLLPYFSGGALYLAFLLVFGQKEARYLLPLLPFWTLLIATGTRAVLLKSHFLGILIPMFLASFTASELFHFSDPVYRADLPRTIAMHIREWSKNDKAGPTI